MIQLSSMLVKSKSLPIQDETFTLHSHLSKCIITLMEIELVPDLSHCVETMARKEYQNLARSYIPEGKEDTEFQEKIELLRGFLEAANFRKLRQESEAYLLKGKKVKFILYREGNETRYRLIID